MKTDLNKGRPDAEAVANLAPFNRFVFPALTILLVCLWVKDPSYKWVAYLQDFGSLVFLAWLVSFCLWIGNVCLAVGNDY